MKYITPALKDMLSQNLGVSYVIEGEEGHNREKQEDGSFRENNIKLIRGDIVPQNDLITIDFASVHGEPLQLTMNSDELRAFGEELIRWAELVEETI